MIKFIKNIFMAIGLFFMMHLAYGQNQDNEVKIIALTGSVVNEFGGVVANCPSNNNPGVQMDAGNIRLLTYMNTPFNFCIAGYSEDGSLGRQCEYTVTVKKKYTNYVTQITSSSPGCEPQNTTTDAYLFTIKK